MATAIVKAEAALAPAQFFSEEQEKIILNTYLGGASKAEAAVLLATVQRRKLDPFSRQVFFVKRWDAAKREEVWAIQTSIDGLRSIADRTGRYEGQTKPEWCGPDGAWRDVWLDEKPPAAARVGVYKAGFREPAYGIARFVTYVQTKRDGTPTQFWTKMPDLMLAKCAEALALRKAFPEDTAGLYVSEEMGNDEPSHAAPVAQLPPSQPKPAPKSEPVVEREPDLVEQDNTRRAARALVEQAAAVMDGEVVETKPIPKQEPQPVTADGGKRIHPGLLWKRITAKKTPKMAADWIASVLGAHKSYSSLTDEERGKLVAELDRLDTVP